MVTINDRIRRVRELLSMNQHEIALRAGLAQRDVSRIENGRAKFIPNEFMHFLHKIGVNMNYLYGDQDALPFSHTSTHLNEKYKIEKETSIQGDKTGIGKEICKDHPLNSGRLIKLIDKLEGDQDAKEKLKNELIRLLIELNQSKDKIIHLMQQLHEMADNLNKKFKAGS